MQTIDIHLAELADWRALLTKAQFVAQTEIHTVLEEYLLRLLFRVTKMSSVQSKVSRIHHGDGQGALAEEGGLEDFSQTIRNYGANESVDLVKLGDHCLLSAGLFPEQAIRRNLPITYFVKVGQAAYREIAEVVEEPVYSMLSDYFVDAMDILQILRELEHDEPCIDPLNAYELWQDTGSTHAWQVLSRLTSSLPGTEQSAVIH